MLREATRAHHILVESSYKTKLARESVVKFEGPLDSNQFYEL